MHQCIMFFSSGQDYLFKLHVDTITHQGKGICRVVQKMLLKRVRGKKPKKVAYCRNTIMVRLLSADKLHWANQRVDSNYPARAVLMMELCICYHTRKMVFKM